MPFRGAAIAECVFDDEGDEDAEGEDLEGETADGNVNGGAAAPRSSAGEGAAEGLQDEGEDVAGDEDPVIEFGGEAGVLWTEVDDAGGC